MGKKDRRAWCPYIAEQHRDVLHVYDPVHEQNYYIAYGVSRKRFIEIAKDNGASIEVGSDCTGKFVVITVDGTEIALVWANEVTDLAHECLHAANWALWRRGLRHNEDTEESFAYLVRFLMRVVLKK